MKSLLFVLFVAITTIIPVSCFAAEKPTPPVTASMLDATHGLIIFPSIVTISDTAAITFDVSDVKIKSYILSSKGGNTLHFYLTAPLQQPVRLTITGDISPVNAADTAPVVKNLLVMPSVWPANRKNLVFLWESKNAPNLVLFNDDVNYTSCKLTGDSKIFDDKGRVKSNSGVAIANEIVSKTAIAECHRNKALSIELSCTPYSIQEKNTTFISIGNIIIRRDSLSFFIDFPGNKPSSKITIQPCPLSMAAPFPPFERITISINSKELNAYQGSTKTYHTKLTPNFFSRWKGNDIKVGSSATNKSISTIDAITIYSRSLSANDAQISTEAAAKRLTPMETAQIVVKAKLVAMTPTPLPKDILPYKHALITHKYLILDVLKGYKIAANKDDNLLVARWGIISAKQTALANMKVGDECELTLENFKDHPDLEHQYTVDALTDEYDLPYMLDMGKK